MNWPRFLAVLSLTAILVGQGVVWYSLGFYAGERYQRESALRSILSPLSLKVPLEEQQCVQICK